MKSLIFFALAGCLIGFGTLTTLAQSSRFYVTGDLGGTITSDTHLKGLPQELGPDYPPTSVDEKVKFDPGLELGIAGGYQLTDYLGLEAQTGFMYSPVSSVEGPSSASFSGRGFRPERQ